MAQEFPKLTGPVVLAPMEEVSNIPFRILCRNYGASMAYTEQTSALALDHDNQKSLQRVSTCKEDRPLGLQLFGRNPELLLKIAKRFEPTVNLIDLNFGCPSKKIVQQGYGSALLKEKERVFDIIHTLSQGLKKPLTIKMRSGFKKVEAVSLVKVMEKAGVSAITLHARTQQQGYSGKADWSIIKKVKETVAVPVIGNGDIIQEEDVPRRMKETKCDYVMVGRAARDNPLFFKQITHFLTTGKKLTITDEEKMQVFDEYLNIAKIVKSQLSLKNIKETAVNFSTGIVGGKHLRQGIMKVRSHEEVVSLVDAFKKNIKS